MPRLRDDHDQIPFTGLDIRIAIMVGIVTLMLGLALGRRSLGKVVAGDIAAIR